MSKHQIIYTSCMRGINGVNDGQQVYSYDAGFQDSNADDVKSLFTYQVPVLDTGVVMTEKLALSMPQAYIYRRLGNDTCAIALNTYLGRDYMGSAGRFGNHLSHSIICHDSDLSCYPCEFYGGEMLRNRMEHSEVNNPDKPSYLSAPKLIKGYRVDVDSVIEFLGADNRMEILKKMLASMLAYESARKRVVICDEVENIIMWIAGLEYVLPLRNALNVNFTTYEFDPSLSASQICGVTPNGTRYSPSNAGQHFTFDMFHNITPDIKIGNEFFDFIDTAMSFSYDSLQAFHEFLVSKFSYDKADENYYDAYSLYSVFSDGIENISLETYKNAISFTNKFASDVEKRSLLLKLLSEKEGILKLDNSFSASIIEFMLSHFNLLSASVQEQIRTLIVERIIVGMADTDVDKNSFIQFYSYLKQLSESNNLSIPYELMKEKNRNRFLSAMKNDTTTWKWEFIVDTICGYIKVKPVPIDELTIEYPVGSLLGGIVQSIFSVNENRGFALLTKIIDEFTYDYNYLINLSMNLEGILFDLQNSERIIATFWKYVYQIFVKCHYMNRKLIINFFLNYDRFEQAFNLFREYLQNSNGVTDGNKLFEEQLNIHDQKYLEKYYVSILQAYYDYLCNNSGQETLSAKKALLDLIIEKRINVLFVDDLIDEVLKSIPLERPSRGIEKIISSLCEYNLEYRKQSITGHLQFLAVGMLFGEVKKRKELMSAIQQIKNVTSSSKIDLSILSDRNIEKYFDWIVSNISVACESSNDFFECYNLFSMARSASTAFISMCAKECLKQSKRDKDYNILFAFIEFLFSAGSANDREEIGKILCKLNKQVLEEMDAIAKLRFGDNGAYLTYWDDIREIATSTNPLLNNISNLFKRRKD